MQASGYRWIVLLIMLLVQAAVSLLQQAPAALGPVLTQDLSLSRTQLGMLFASTYGGMVIATLPTGILIDHEGERRVILVGITAMGALAFAAAWTSSFVWLIGILVLAGLAGASASPGGSRAISAWFPQRQWGMALGIRQTGVTIGGLVAALLLPLVAVKSGWPAGFQAVAILCLLTVLGFAVFYPMQPEPTDLRSRPPVTSLLRHLPLLTVGVYSFVFSGAQGCAVSYIPLFAHQRAGLSITASGAILGILQIGGITGRIGWGILSDRLGRRGPIMLLVGMISVVSCFLMVLIGAGTPRGIIPLLVFALGCSVVGWNGLYFAIVSEMVGVQAAATAMGVALTMTYLGPLLIPPVFGLIVDRTGSYPLSWLALAGWTAVGTLLAYLVWQGERSRRQRRATL